MNVTKPTALLLPLTLALVLALTAAAVLAGIAAPGEAPDTSENAVLRVRAPEGEPYAIQWADGRIVRDELPEGEPYRDYPVPADGTIEVSKNGIDSARQDWHGTLYTTLYVDDEIRSCDTSGNHPTDVGTALVNGTTYGGSDAWIESKVCASHRYFAWLV